MTKKEYRAIVDKMALLNHLTGYTDKTEVLSNLLMEITEIYSPRNSEKEKRNSGEYLRLHEVLDNKELILEWNDKEIRAVA